MPVRRGFLWVLAGLASAAVAWCGVALGLHAVHAGEILPGTRVAGVDVGALGPDEARQRLAPALRDTSVTLTYRDRRFTLNADKLGYRVNMSATVTRAMRSGRDGVLKDLLWSDVASLWQTSAVAPVTTLDQQRLKQSVRSVAQRVDRPLSYGDLSIDPDTLRVKVEPPRPSRAVDQQAAVRAIVAALHRPDRDTISLPVATKKVDKGKVRAVADDARAYLKKPLRLTRKGTTIEVTPEELAPLLTVMPAGDGQDFDVRLGMRKKQLRRLAGSLQSKVEQEPVDARISAPARSVTLDEQGGLTWKPQHVDVDVEPGRPGRSLSRPATAHALRSAVRHGRHSGKLPVQVEHADVPTKAARDVDALIGTFTTHFKCCEPRVTNIQQMAETVDGTVVMPGDEFSLNGVVGERTRAKGYVPAPYIFRGKLKPDVGGGVSQFSTTTYNAAFFAGLPITDHQPHSYYISRYPVGRESTLNYPTIDLTWTNDTDAPILVRAVASGTSVSVSLYGDNGGRTVEAIAGPREPWSSGAFKITVTRKVTYSDGRTEQDADTVHYDKPPEE